MQIRTRLTLQFMAAVTLLVAITFSIVYVSSSFYRENELYQRLDNKAQTSAEMFVSVEQIDSTMMRLFDQAQKDKLPQEVIVIYDAKNREVYASNDSIRIDADEGLLDDIRRNMDLRFSQGAMELLGKVYQDSHNKFVVIAGAQDLYGLSKLKNLRNTLLGLFLASISIIALAGWIYAGRALLPLSQVIGDMERLDLNRLNRRLSTSRHRDEIGRLIDKFNMLLDRIEKAVNLQKLFITGASHELKNPLTAITSQLQVALLKERQLGEYKTLIKSILDDIKILNKTTNDLMEFARLTHETEIPLDPVRIDDVIWETAEYFSVNQPDYRLEIRMDALPIDENRLVVKGHKGLLLVALVNLADNACKFSPDQSCTIVLTAEANGPRVSVEDKGPGIEEHLVPYIFEPFFRGNSTSQLRGHGIGLALTRKILELHRAELTINTKRGVGSRFSIAFGATGDVKA